MIFIHNLLSIFLWNPEYEQIWEHIQSQIVKGKEEKEITSLFKIHFKIFLLLLA